MTLSIIQAIQINVPTVVFGSNIGVNSCNVVMQDIQDGNGPFIGIWAVPNVPQPTLDQITAWQNDPTTLQKYTLQQNAIANAPIQTQLDAIDLQSIRALREPGTASTTKLTNLTTQAATLRAQLLPTK